MRAVITIIKCLPTFYYQFSLLYTFIHTEKKFFNLISFMYEHTHNFARSATWRGEQAKNIPFFFSSSPCRHLHDSRRSGKLIFLPASLLLFFRSAISISVSLSFFTSFALFAPSTNIHQVHKFIKIFVCAQKWVSGTSDSRRGSKKIVKRERERETELLNELFTSVHSPEKTNEYGKQLVSSFILLFFFRVSGTKEKLCVCRRRLLCLCPLRGKC